MPRKATMTEWVCTACGRHSMVSKTVGRPILGMCPKALIQGRPHRWIKNHRAENTSGCEYHNFTF